MGSGSATPRPQVSERVSVGKGGESGAGEVASDDCCESEPLAQELKAHYALGARVESAFAATGGSLEPALERMGRILQIRIPAWSLVGDRLVRSGPLDPTFAAAQSKAVSAAAGGQMV